MARSLRWAGGGETRHAQALAERPPVSGCASQLDASGLHRVHQWQVTETHACQRLRFRRDLDIDVVPRIEQAEVDLGALQHEPILAIVLSSKLEERDDTSRRKLIAPDHPPERPHQEVRVEMFVGEILARPLVTPSSQRL